MALLGVQREPGQQPLEIGAPARWARHGRILRPHEPLELVAARPASKVVNRHGKILYRRTAIPPCAERRGSVDSAARHLPLAHNAVPSVIGVPKKGEGPWPRRSSVSSPSAPPFSFRDF